MVDLSIAMLNYQRVNILWYWLVVSNMNFIFHTMHGMSSFPLTNSYFSRWLKPPTRIIRYIVIIFIYIHLLSPGICETFIDLHCFSAGNPHCRTIDQWNICRWVDGWFFLAFRSDRKEEILGRYQGCTQLVQWFGYGSIPIDTIISGMNIHKSQLWLGVHQGYKVLTHPHLGWLKPRKNSPERGFSKSWWILWGVEVVGNWPEIMSWEIQHRWLCPSWWFKGWMNKLISYFCPEMDEDGWMMKVHFYAPLHSYWEKPWFPVRFLFNRPIDH